jgi:Xaa-Pro aminopeptidase
LQLKKDSLALLIGQVPQRRNGDVHHPFRQKSDVWYLAPITDPHVVLIIDASGRTTVFCKPCSDLERLWEGDRIDHTNACKAYGVEEALPLETLDAWIDAQSDRTFYVLEEDMSNAQTRWPHRTYLPLDPLLHSARLIKDDTEISCLRKAAEIGVAGHLAAMKTARHVQDERSLTGVLLQGFYQAGSAECAYSSIVASGSRACTLHYHANDATWAADDLILIDAGAEYRGYASDITRTFPASGQFTIPQKTLYQLVLDVQLTLLAMIRPGATWLKLEKYTQKKLTEGLMHLGILKSPQDYRQYCPHSVGHWLGLDVHDVGGKMDCEGNPIAFTAGMVITIEPGVYIPMGSDTPELWHGIGIRIEDDILVTADGCEVLTAALPKTIDDIEQCMRS